jgi:hypothetical protein
VEGGSAVVEIDDGGKWTRLRLYSVEVIATPHRMRAEVLGQQEWGLLGRFGCPLQIGGSSTGLAGVLFLA